MNTGKAAADRLKRSREKKARRRLYNIHHGWKKRKPVEPSQFLRNNRRFKMKPVGNDEFRYQRIDDVLYKISKGTVTQIRRL
jgi:hypothetical protein